MRVLLLADANSPHVQGWARALAPEVSRLFLYSFAAPLTEWYRAIPNLEVDSLGLSAIGRSSLDPRKLRYLLSGRVLSRITEGFGPDLVHAHYASSYGFVGARLARRPFLVSAWGSDVLRFPEKSRVHRRLLMHVLEAADGILATSRALADALRRYTSKRVTVLPFGVDLERFAPRPADRPRNGVLTVGAVKHLEPEYGIDLLLRAFALVVREGGVALRLLVAGDGSEQERCRALVDSLGLRNEVELVGRLEHANVPALLSRCDLVVNPSRLESFGVSVLEAGACGVPVVATRVSGVVEIVDHEKTGLLVPPDDETAMAGAIRRLLDDPELRRRLGGEARRRVVERYDLRELAREQVRYYRKAIERSHRRSVPAVAKSRINGRTGME